MSRVLLPSLLALVLLGAGCGGDDASPAERSADRPAGTPAARPSVSSTPPPTPTEPTESPTRAPRTSKGPKTRSDDQKQEPPSVAARADASRAHLLTADTLPRLRGQEWTVRVTGPEESPVGACQKTALVDIGAVRALRRSFSAPDASGVSAHQVVARFADARSAWRAHEVLRSWHDDCAERLDGATTDVGDLEEVVLTAGTGGHYRSTYGGQEGQHTAGLGIVRMGRWLSVVELSSADEDYPTRREPSRRAVRRIAATFA